MKTLLRISALLAIASFAANAQSPGQRYTPPSGFSSTVDGAYTIAHLVGRQPITKPISVMLACSLPNCPAVLQWNYDFTFGREHYHYEFKHMLTASDTPLSILADFREQFVGTAIIKEAIGADIVGYAYVRSEEQKHFTFFQSWPFVRDAEPKVTAVAGVTVEGGGPTLEVAPFLACVRSTFDQGRPPQAGDLLCGIYFVGDTPDRAADSRNVDPILGQIIAAYTDPATRKISLTFSFDSVRFNHAITTPGVKITDWIMGPREVPLLKQDASSTYLRAPEGGDIRFQDNSGRDIGVTKTCEPSAKIVVKNGLIVDC
jgi:hypothetical protein